MGGWMEGWSTDPDGGLTAASATEIGALCVTLASLSVYMV